MVEHAGAKNDAEYEGTGTLTDAALPGAGAWHLTVGDQLVYHEVASQDGSARRLQHVAEISLQGLSEGDVRQLHLWLREHQDQDLYLHVARVADHADRQDPTDPSRLHAIGAICGETASSESERRR